MLSSHRIRRLIEARAWRRLIEQVLGNGRCRNETAIPALLEVLARPGVGEASALGLALQRVTELSYGTDPLVVELSARLLRLQNDDGTFGLASGSGERPLATTAVAARALDAVVCDCHATDAELDLDPHLLFDVRDRAIDAIESLLARTRHSAEMRNGPNESVSITEVERALVLDQLARLSHGVELHGIAA